MNKKLSYIFKRLTFFKEKEIYSNGLSSVTSQGREWENFYRNRWQHDKVVRSTHGINCTGSCSWKVFVKEGIITWEIQATDYPTTGPDMPEYEPRGCPRGASFSWYEYSPTRVKYPYIRGILLDYWKEALKTHKNPIEAWASIVEDPEKTKKYKSARGKGGFVRASWEEMKELIAAQLLYTVKKYGPDRIIGFTPIPAMSMVSYASGARFITLMGGSMLSFYDWYADLPPASPQVWGEQTDVPESGDWFNAGYIIMWGSNVPMTRSPDAHFMTESRYKGTKIVSVSPDFAESVKFADEWLGIEPGTDGALAQAMTHVILKEFYVENKTEYFYEYAKKYTDLPFLITLKPDGDKFVLDRFLRASDLNIDVTNAEWKTVVLDKISGEIVVPNGSIGHRWEHKGKWNLKFIDENGKKFDPEMTILGKEDDIIVVKFPYFDDKRREIIERSVPVKKIQVGDKTYYVTTVFDTMLANYGIKRSDRDIGYPENYEDKAPYTPAWQEEFTHIPAKQVIKIAREFAQNAIDTRGKSMIIMGAGINHWYHSDMTYRTILNLVILTGCEGISGGGWAHYVGQEKLRPFEGWQTVAFAKDWQPAPRLQNGTSFFYFATDQYRYEETPLSNLASPTVKKPRYEHPADYNLLSVRLGWSAFYPQFNKNTLELTKEAKKTGAKENEDIINYLVNKLKNKEVEFSLEDPDAPDNFPRTLFVWRANLLGASGKGYEYFLKHLLGTKRGGILSNETKQIVPTKEVKWRDKAPEGKLDLMVTLEFRMTGTALYSDIILPAATWYEKHDLSSTDMHPFIHPFNPAITPPWEAKNDWNSFKELAKAVSEMAEKYLPEVQTDIVASPMMHDTPGETAQPFGKIKDWTKGEVEPIPGKTMPKLTIIERDYTKIYEKYSSLGPLVKEKPIGANGVNYSAKEEYEELKRLIGVKHEGIAKDLPNLEYDKNVCNTLLSLSSASNGKLAQKAWAAEAEKTGLDIYNVAISKKEEHFTHDSITVQPREAISTPVFTGYIKDNGRYTPFNNNIDLLMPFRTLTGRQQFYMDHEMMLEYGEGLPVYKPTVAEKPFVNEIDNVPTTKTKTLNLKFITPHGKWGIHSMYKEGIRMQTLSRGNPVIWINNEEAEELGIKDNDWVEIYNRRGVIIARAIVSHRMKKGSIFMYHAQDSLFRTPASEITGEGGGTHNTTTGVFLKPTHMIGGYAQFSYGFNYYGATGHQRDTRVFIKKLTKVVWNED